MFQLPAAPNCVPPMPTISGIEPGKSTVALPPPKPLFVAAVAVVAVVGAVVAGGGEPGLSLGQPLLHRLLQDMHLAARVRRRAAVLGTSSDSQTPSEVLTTTAARERC